MKIVGKESIKKLFSDLGVTYLDRYYISVEKLNSFNLKSTDYYKENIEEFTALENLYGSKIRESYVAPVYIQQTNERGYGLYALKDISEGDFLGIYFGVVKEQDEMVTYDETGLGTDYAWTYPDELEGFPVLEIDAKPMGSEMRFANHSFKSNLDVEHTVVDNCWYIFFIANRDISKDEELTISYGEEYWESEYRELIEPV